MSIISFKPLYLALEIFGFIAFDHRLFHRISGWITGETDRETIEQWRQRLIPIRWFMLYCSVVNIILIPHYSQTVYFRLYWYLTLPEIVWMSYLGQHVCRKFSDRLAGSNMLHGAWIYVAVRSAFMLNLPAGGWPLHTRRAVEMRDFAIEALLVAAGVILMGILVMVGRKYLPLAFAVLLLVLSALIPALWWAFRGYRAEISGYAWTAALLVLLSVALGLGWLNGHRSGLSRRLQSALQIAHRAQR